MGSTVSKFALAMLCVAVALATRAEAAADVDAIVRQAVQSVMTRYGVPGMAVGIVTAAGSHVYDFGVASKATGQPITDRTLFELGSVSKTFTATLASYAQVDHRLSLSDPVGKDFPALRGSRLDAVSLLDLGTHMSGGMPLQFPDDVTTDDQMIRYFRDWKPSYPPGTMRTYANPSIGLLGLIAAKSMNEDFDGLMEHRLFPTLGLDHTYLHVPDARMTDYAQGYTKADGPIRMAPGVLGSEAYGVKSTVVDMTHFLAANMGMVPLAQPWRTAVTDTHTGYFRVGPLTQDLIWEQYAYPVDLKELQAGNSATMGFEANPAVRLDPPSAPHDDVLLDKTGSTNGFAAYVVIVPAKKIGIVLLANKNYPIEARVAAAYEILTRLDDKPPT